MSKNRRVIASPSLKHSLYTCCIHPYPFFSCSIAERKKKAKIKLSWYKYSLRLAFTRRRPTYTASLGDKDKITALPQNLYRRPPLRFCSSILILWWDKSISASNFQSECNLLLFVWILFLDYAIRRWLHPGLNHMQSLIKRPLYRTKRGPRQPLM